MFLSVCDLAISCWRGMERFMVINESEGGDSRDVAVYIYHDCNISYLTTNDDCT